jgi:hypothetical protein
VGTTVAWALVDDNHDTPTERAAQIGKQATLARQRGQARQAREAREAREVREAQLEARFAALNPEFGVLPSRTDPDQHRFAHGRERALALGARVHLAEARENTADAELAAWQVRDRALRAGRLARQRRQEVER